MTMKKIISAILAFTVALSSGCTNKEPSEPNTSDSAADSSGSLPEAETAGEMRDISTAEIVKEMKFGINLGNTMESSGFTAEFVSQYEKGWGSPTITQEAIQCIADAGFGVLRIPVAWSNMMSTDGNYTINPDYDKRVHEITDWALDAGLYVIINLHWDGGWLNKFPEDKQENMKHYRAIWTQVSDSFKSYGDKLMFEAQNEELGWDSIWNRYSGTNGEEKQASYALVNEVNQAFVDVVRASGGNNEKRHLLISGYNTDIDLTCDELFKMPEDPAGRMAVSVHYYNPSTLTILDKDADWGKAQTEWGSEKDLAELDRCITLMKETFIDNGIPVIVGEYGCFGNNKTRELREYYMTTVSSEMYKAGMCPILWDTSGNELNRFLAEFTYPDFIEKLVSPSRQDQSSAEPAA